MVDAALNVAAEQVIEYSAYGALLQRTATAGRRRRRRTCTAPTRSTSSVGATAGWPSPSPPTSSGRALRDALGRPDWAIDPTLATAAGRRGHHDLIDEHLAAWCAQRTGDEIVETLWDAGVPVAKVMQPHRQTETAAAGFPRLLRRRRATR